MQELIRQRLAMASLVAATTCTVSISLFAADTVEPAPRKAGTVTGAVGGAAHFVEDVAITSTVKTKLVASPLAKARDIKVITDKGVVTLIGEVDSTDEIREAEAIVNSVEGVQSVKNELKLKRP